MYISFDGLVMQLSKLMDKKYQPDRIHYLIGLPLIFFCLFQLYMAEDTSSRVFPLLALIYLSVEISRLPLFVVLSGRVVALWALAAFSIIKLNGGESAGLYDYIIAVVCATLGGINLLALWGLILGATKAERASSKPVEEHWLHKHLRQMGYLYRGEWHTGEKIHKIGRESGPETMGHIILLYNYNDKKVPFILQMVHQSILCTEYNAYVARLMQVGQDMSKLSFFEPVFREQREQLTVDMKGYEFSSLDEREEIKKAICDAMLECVIMGEDGKKCFFVDAYTAGMRENIRAKMLLEVEQYVVQYLKDGKRDKYYNFLHEKLYQHGAGTEILSEGYSRPEEAIQREKDKAKEFKMLGKKMPGKSGNLLKESSNTTLKVAKIKQGHLERKTQAAKEWMQIHSDAFVSGAAFLEAFRESPKEAELERIVFLLCERKSLFTGVLIEELHSMRKAQKERIANIQKSIV